MPPPDDYQLASCSDDGVRVWNRNGSPLPRPTRPAATSLADPFSCVLWYPSGKLLAAGSRNGAVALYLQGTLAYLSELRPPSAQASPVSAVDVSSGSRYLAVGAVDGSLCVWDMKNRAIDVSFRDSAGGSAASVSIQRTAESRYVACARGSDLSVYSRASKRLVSKFLVEGVSVTAISFSPHHINIVAAVDDTGCVTVFDITRAKAESSSSAKEGSPVIARFPSPSLAPATDIAFCSSPTASFAFCVSALDKTIRLFALGSGACRMLYSFTCSAPVTCVAIAPDQTSLAAGTSGGAICVYHLASGRDAEFYSHSLTSEIERAHIVPQGCEADGSAPSAAVRALHYRPRLDPVPASSLASTSSRAAAVAAAAVASAASSDHPGFGVARSKSASADALRPALERDALRSALPSQGQTRTPPREPLRGVGNGLRAHGPRDSDIFSPLPSAAGPGGLSRSDSTSKRTPGIDYNVFESDDEKEPRTDGSKALPLELFGARRDTTYLPAKQTDVSFGTLNSESVEDRSDSDGKSIAESFCEAGSGHAPCFQSVRSNSFRHGNMEALAAASNLLEPTSDRDSFGAGQRCIETEPSSDAKVFQSSRPGVASRSASDMNRKRLPPLPPRSLSDDAMAAHLHAPLSEPGISATRKTLNTKAQPPSPSPAPPSATVEAAPLETIVATPSSVASTRRRVLHGPAAGSYEETSLRRIVSEEVGSVTADLRSDVKNLHTELVLSLARQEALFSRIMDEKDKRVKELESQVKQLKLENRQLRGTSRKQEVPAWMQY
jgi:hypothetical protein